MLVPKLRFKEFKNEWKKIKLKDISTDISYGMNSASTEFDGINKYIRITDIDEETSLYSNNPVSPLGNLDDKFLVKENDILFARTGASTGKSYLYSKVDGKLYFAGFLIRANIQKDYNSRFIFEQTKLSKYNNWIKIMSIRSGQPGINSIEYGNYEFSITHFDEQNKIANLINLLNKKIELQQRKIEDLKIYRRGLIKELFSFNTFYEKNLEDLCHITTGKLDANAMTINGKYRFYTCAKEYYHINTYAFDTEALLISGNGAYVGYIHYYKGKFNAYQRTYVLDNFNENIFYIKYYLDTFLPQRILTERKEGNTPYIVLSTLAKMPIIFPSIEIQNQIITTLSKFDIKLTLENKKLDNLNIMKKSLLQQMFI